MVNMLKTTIVFVVLSSIIGCGFVNKTFRKDSTPQITAADIEGMIQKARPLIQEITGRTFSGDIEYEIVTRHDVRNAIAEEVLPDYEKLMKGLSDDLIAKQVETDAFQTSMSIFGRYSESRKTLSVVPENIKFIMKMFGGNEADFKDYVFLVVVHEMIHMLDDQYFDFNKIMVGLDGMEEINSFGALLEGHAVYVTNTISERLHLSEEAKLMQTKSAAGHTDYNARIQSQQLYNIYVKGSEFVEAVVKEKGASGIDAAFAAPPRSTREILNPNEYLSGNQLVSIDCKGLLEKTTAALPTEGMVLQTMTMGAINIGTMLIGNGIPGEEAETIASACLDGAAFVASRRTLKPKTIWTMALYFKNQNAACEYIELGRKMEKISEIQTNAKLNANCTVLKEEVIPIDGIEKLLYREVETKTDGVVDVEKSIEGHIGALYLSAGCSNMDIAFGEKELVEFISTLKKAVENS